jgi:hypothetical protein
MRSLSLLLQVFPNSHVHKVEEMVNRSIAEEEDEEGAVTNKTKAKRRIVVFFCGQPYAPNHVNTRGGTPAGVSGWMSLDAARAHRLQLMEERKFHKQDWNVREVEVCEH